MRDFIEFPRRGQVTSERLFNDDTRIFSQLRLAKPSNHRFEERRGNCQIVRGPPRFAQYFFDRCERAWVFVIAAHIVKQEEELL